MGQSPKNHPVPILILVSSAVVLLAPIGLSAPFTNEFDTQSPTCRNSSLNYSMGDTHTYDFEIEVITESARTTNEKSKVSITGKALVYVQSPCQLVLTIKNSKISVGATRQLNRNTGLSSFESSSLRFAFQDGSIGTVWTDPLDPSWSVNIKRGLASMLQNSALDSVRDAPVMETDVSGRCPTTYTVSRNGNTKTFTKTKALESCMYRDGGIWVLQGTPYQVFSKQNTIPLVKSSQTCEQTVNGIIRSVKCSESHILTTLSAGKGEATSTVSTKLTYNPTSQERSTITASHATIASSILFDYSNTDVSGVATNLAIKSAKQLLVDICRQTATGTVTAVVPGLINSLRRTIKSIRRTGEFVTIYNTIKNDAQCSSAAVKIFTDTVAKAGTTESISFMADLMAQKKLDAVTQKIFSLYTSFAPRPDCPALLAFTYLLNNTEIVPEVLLAASALAHRYCAETNPSCGSNSIYTSLVNSIAKIGRESCMAQEDSTTNLAINALQALGNMESLTTDAEKAIMECMKSSDRIQMAALQAFRRNPCNPKLKEMAYNNLKDMFNVTSELRIQAYLAVVRCVKQEDVKKIQEILDNEKSNQVGSFITSHITNILASPTPKKREIRIAFQQLSLPKDGKFPNDLRKFSRNFDYSTFSPETNLGFSAEGNLVFSQESFIPRSVSVKLDCEIFGRSYNFLEINTLHYFEPKGKACEDDPTPGNANSRSRRDVAAFPVDRHAIEKKFSEATRRKDRFDSSGQGDIYIRLLETTVLARSFTQDQLREKFSSDKFAVVFDQLIAGAKDYNIERTEPITFIDNEIVVPTVSGLPLNLEVEGTTVLSLELNGKLDMNTLFSSKTSDTKLRFVPSAATLLRAKMSVGAGPVESGLQLEGKLHTASGIDFAITRQEGKFEVKLNLPEDKVQVLSLRTQLVWVEAEDMMLVETPVVPKFAPTRESTPFCAESSRIGLRFCGQTQYANPNAIGGDSLFALSIEKTEPSMEGYYFMIETVLKNETEKKISLIFDTPKSTTNRKITADGRYSLGQSPHLGLDVILPGNHLNLEYQRWDESYIKGYEVKYKLDNYEYSAGATVKITKDENKRIYEPLITYNSSKISRNFLDGKITHDIGKELSFGIRISDALGSQLRTNLSGSVQTNRIDKLNSDYRLSNVELSNEALGKLIIGGTVDLKEVKNALNMTVKYGMLAQSTLAIDTEISHPSPKADKFAFSVASTRRALNFDIKYDKVEIGNETNANLIIERSGDDDSKFKLSQSTSYNIQSNKLFDIHNLIELKYPSRGLDWFLKTDAKSASEVRMTDVQLRIGSNISANLQYSAIGEDFSTYDLSGNMKHKSKLVKFSENATKLNSHAWKYLTAFNYTSEGKSIFHFNGDTDLTLRNENYDIESEIVSKITSSVLAEPLQLNSNVISRKDIYHAHLTLSKISGDILKLSSDYQRGSDNVESNFTSKIFLNEYLDARLEENHARGSAMSSKFKMEATWIPSGRKIIAISNLRNQEDTYNYNGTVQWNATGDPRKSITFTSVTSVSRTRYDLNSRNTLVLMGIQRGLDLKANTSAEYYNGDNTGSIVYTNSDGQSYSLQMKNINKNSDKIISSVLGATLNLPDQKPFVFELTNRAANFNMSKFMFEVNSELTVNYNGSQNIHLQAEAKSLITNKRTMLVLVDASGSAISDTVKIEFTSDIQSGILKTYASTRYGQKTGKFDIDLQYDNWSPKSTLDLKYKLSTPFTTIQNLDGSYKISYIYSSWDNYEYSNSGNVSFNNAVPTTWDNGISFANVDFLARYNFYPNGKAVILSSAKGYFGDKKITLKANSVLRGGTETKFLLDTDRNCANVKFDFDLTSPYPAYEKVELLMRHKLRKRGGQEGYSTSVQGSVNNETITLTNKLDLSNSKKGMVLSLTNNAGVKQVSFVLSGIDTKNYSVDTMISWGGDKFISTKGNLLKSGSSIGGDLTLHSPTYKVDNWTVQVSQTGTQNGGNILSLHTLNAQQEQGSVVVEYVIKNNALLSSLVGSVTIKMGTAAAWGGTFEAEDKTYTVVHNREEGRGMSVTLQLKSEQYPVKLRVSGKRTTEENLYETSFCSTDLEEDCKKADVRYKTVRGENGMDGYEFSTTFCTEGDQECKKAEVIHKQVNEDGVSGDELSILVKINTEGKTVLDGLVFKSLGKFNPSSRKQTIYEKSVKLITTDGESDDGEHQSLGFRIFNNQEISEPKSGIEIHLPERELGILFTMKDGPLLQEQIVEVWLDKLRKPGDKLTVSLVYDRKDTYTVLVIHPELQRILKKDLKVSSQIKKDQNGYLYDTSTEFDIFKVGNEPLKAIFKVKKASQEPSSSFAYTIDMGLKGLITISARSDIIIGTGEYLTKTTIDYLNSHLQMRQYLFTIDSGANHRTLEFIEPGGLKFLYTSRYSYQYIPHSKTNEYDGYTVRKELFVPGLEDSFIYDQTVSTLFPPNAQVKLFTRNSRSGSFYEGWIGFKSDQQFLAGFYFNKGMEQQIISDLTLALNNTRFLFVKSTWDKENFKMFLDKANDHLTDIAIQYKKIQYASSENITQEAAYIRSVITRALPGLNPILKHYSNEIDELEEELQHADSKIMNSYIRAHAEFFLSILGTDIEEVKRQANEIRSIFSRIFQGALNALGAVPDFFFRVIDQIPKMIDAIRKGMVISGDKVVKASKMLLKGISSVVDRISKSYYEGGDSYNYVYDTSKGIGKVLKDILSQTLDKLSETWKSLENRTEYIRNLKIVRDYFQYYSVKYEQMAASTIAEYKKTLDSWRESILSAFSDRESQEFLISSIEYIEKMANQESMNHETAQTEIYKKFLKAMEKMKSRFFDFGQGIIIARVPLPMPLKSLTDFNYAFKKAMASYSFQMPSTSYSPVNYFSKIFKYMYNQFRVPTPMDDLLPPYTGTALLVGSQFKTFDNLIYNFEGKCQYVLAADFIRQNLTIIVDYSESTDTKVKKSITLTNLQDYITIKHDYTVLINGRLTNLPASAGELKVDKHNNWITANGRPGVSVSVFTLQEVSIVKMAGCYQGTTNGLLGTYNNEMFDDFNSPTGQILNSVQQMAAGWKLGQCQEKSITVKPSPIDSFSRDKCATALTGMYSPLRSCNSFVTPTDYQSMCESLSREKGYNSSRAVCTVSAAYKAICNIPEIEESEQCLRD